MYLIDLAEMEQLSVTYLGSWPRDTIPSNKPAHNSTACYVIDFKGLGPSSPNTKENSARPLKRVMVITK